MEPNPYQPPRELGTKPAPEKWDTASRILFALLLCTMLLSLIGALFLDLVWGESGFGLLMMATGLISATVFAFILYGYRRQNFYLALAILLATMGAICAMLFVGGLAIAFYLNIPLP